MGDDAYEVDFQRKGTYQEEEDEAHETGSSRRDRPSLAGTHHHDDADEWAGGVTGAPDNVHGCECQNSAMSCVGGNFVWACLGPCFDAWNLLSFC